METSRLWDAVQNRDIMGLARVNLTAKRFDFWAIGPAVQLPVGARPVSFSLAPDRKRAYGLLQEIGPYEFWTFDLERRNLVKTEFDGRARMALRTSTNGPAEQGRPAASTQPP